MQPLEAYLQAQQQRLEAALDHHLPAPDADPPVLSEAMRYSVFAGGKRVRPVLLLAATEAVGGDGEAGAPRRLRPGIRAHLFAHPRRPARHGRR